MAQPLCTSLFAKIEEQLDRTIHISATLPQDLHLTALDSPWTTRQLLNHLLNCTSGFCAVLAAVFPEDLAHFSELRESSANSISSRNEFCQRLNLYHTHIGEGFQLLDDHALARRIPTVFVPSGETVLTLLLGNLEHLINHKHQLFLYAKFFGATLASRDLYHFR